MIDYSNIGKGGIVKEGIFVRFPQLKPSSLPENWGCSPAHKKLMIVMESNYFKGDENSVFKDPEAWYKGDDTSRLIPKEREGSVKNDKAGWPPFDRLCESMNQVSPEIQCEHIYDEALFYNYFLRPATGGKTFRNFCKPLDREVAGTALCGIIELDKPDIVIFASKYAYDTFRNYVKEKIRTGDSKFSFVDYRNFFELTGEETVRIEFVNHPTSRFQKWDENVNSKLKFERLLKEYWLK